MNFNDYIETVTPPGGVFARKEKGLINNLFKWSGLRFGYVFYRLGVTANQLDILGIVVAFIGLGLLASAMINGKKTYAVISVVLIAFHVWIDYIDGAVAKAEKKFSPIGAALDDIGCDLDRFAMIVVFGVVTDNNLIILANTFSAVILIKLYPETVHDIPAKGIIGPIKKIYMNNKSFLSVRFMLAFLPLFLMYSVLQEFNLQRICLFLSVWYVFSALIWLLICLPSYAPK